MTSLVQFRDYEVEVTLNVTAANVGEARAAVARSGLTEGALVGETLVERVEVFGLEDEDDG